MTGPLTRLEPMPTATAAPLVLGIESSCDETGVGVVRGTALLAHESPPPSRSTCASAA